MIGRVALVALLILLGVALEVSLLARLPLPGATPDLVTVLVVAIALAFGSTTGAISGVAAGLALSVAPPATGPIGISALVLGVVGYLVGLASDPEERGALPSIGLAAAACAGALAATSLLMGLVGSPGVQWSDLGLMVLTTAAYGAILGAFVIPLTIRAAKLVLPRVRA